MIRQEVFTIWLHKQTQPGAEMFDHWCLIVEAPTRSGERIQARQYYPPSFDPPLFNFNEQVAPLIERLAKIALDNHDPIFVAA